MTMVEEREVQIARSPTEGFGFSIIGGSNTHLPPMICSLVQDSPAANSKQIRIGDVIHKVNGINAKQLRTREIKKIVHESNEKLVLTLVDDPEARKLAKPFLSEGVTVTSPREGRLTRIATVSLGENRNKSPSSSSSPSPSPTHHRSYAWDRTEKVNTPDNKLPDKKEGKSPKYQRTVGSPDCDRLGADGRFVKCGSLDRAPATLTFEADKGLAGDSRTPVSESGTTAVNQKPEEKDDGPTDVRTDDQQIDESSLEEPYNRLSRPVFGSAPRLNVSSTGQTEMKQTYMNFGSEQRPYLHRRSASHDEQILNFIQQNSTGHDYRTQPYLTGAQNGVGINSRGARLGPTVRFTDHSNQPRHSGQVRHGSGGQIPNVGMVQRTNSYTEVKSSNNAQDLRNAFIKHQLALRNQKFTGLSKRQYNSSEELPVRDYSYRHQVHQNGNVASSRGMPPPSQLGQSFAGHDDAADDDDMQQSGYGVGFRRTNSLGKADTYLNRYNRNQDFVYTDGVHLSQYPNRDDSNRGLHISRLSPALQQRLKNVTSSIGTNVTFTTSGLPNQSPANMANDNRQNELYQTNHYVKRVDHYNLPHSASYSVDYTGNNGVVMRDTEDGMLLSRYEHGKSLAVPTQQFPDEYNSSSGDNVDVYDRNRASFVSRTSVGSRLSEMGVTIEMTSPNKVPDDLKTIDATDLATRLFTLDGFTSIEVAPFLGKNTDFSQHVCNEYMKFFNFEGLAIDEALRTLLQKFPVTGETQERERILLQFSKRYHECNGQLYGSEDSVHTLTCALMLLNTDLHGQNIGTKMTLNDFVNNLSGMCDGQDFSRELLKTLYQSIKNKEIQYAATDIQREMKPSPKIRKPSSNGNPFIELKAHDDAVTLREGMMLRKCIMESDGKRLPAMKRRWKPFHCTLKGLVLFLQKPDKIPSDYSIGIHHSLAGFATEYKKKPFVFKLITADWRVFMFEAKNKSDVQDWVDCINLSAAALSSPPLPAPCSSSKHFIRPVMPVSVTKRSLEDQIKCHVERAESIDRDKQEHAELQPDENSKDFKEWENKMDYLEFEYKRFSAYAKVLCVPRLKEKLEFLLSTRDKPPPAKKEEAPSNKPLRSNSMNDIGNSQQTSPTTRRRMRQSYLQAVHD